MRIVVVGAGSGTGREVARQGVARGHEVVAVARRGCDVPGVTAVAVDARDAGALAPALAGADAVIVTVGGASGVPRNRTEVTRGVLAAMASAAVRRIVVQTSLGVGDSGVYLGAAGRLFAAVALRAALADHEEQEALVRASGLEATFVRPGGLTDAPATGRVALGGEGPLVPRISRADVASFLLDRAEDAASAGRSYALGTPPGGAGR